MHISTAGTTVKITGTFTDPDGEPISVENGLCTIYGSDRETVIDTIESLTDEGAGVYSCLYTTPVELADTRYYAKMSAEYDGAPVVSVAIFSTKWVTR